MWLNRFNRFLVFATFCLIIAGGLVTSTDSGLSVPDWPKSYGMWMPPMVGGVFYEHGHRMVASFVGFLTVIFAIWLWMKEPRKWVRVLGVIALAAVITQGVLGGLTVLYFLPTPISVAHATLAQSFFCLTVALSLFTSREWKQPQPKVAVEGNPRRVFLCTSAVIYLQLILGSWVRHSGAALAISDFPLNNGRIVPHFTSSEVAIHFAHRVWAMVVFSLIVAALITVFRKMRRERRFVVPSVLMVFLAVCQIVLGGYTVLSRTAVPGATAHVAVGALILACSVVLTLRAYRHLEPVSNISLETERFTSENLQRMKPL